jgi:hypothetical protein
LSQRLRSHCAQKKEVLASAEISVRLIEMKKRRTKRKSPRQEGGL